MVTNIAKICPTCIHHTFNAPRQNIYKITLLSPFFLFVLSQRKYFITFTTNKTHLHRVHHFNSRYGLQGCINVVKIMIASFMFNTCLLFCPFLMKQHNYHLFSLNLLRKYSYLFAESFSPPSLLLSVLSFSILSSSNLGLPTFASVELVVLSKVLFILFIGSF